MMVAAAAVSKKASTVDSRSAEIASISLLTIEKDNRNGAFSKQKNAKSRIVSSRYTPPSIPSTSASNSSLVFSSLSSSKRSPSPLVSRNLTPLSNGHSLCPKRSASAERGQHMVARTLSPDLDFKNGNATDVSAAKKFLVTSTRRLSVSFQGEGFSLPVCKTKVASSSPSWIRVRKGSEERGRSGNPFGGKDDSRGDQIDIAKIVDQHRWPSRNLLANQLSKSLDCGIGEETDELIGSGVAIRPLRQSLVDERGSLLGSMLNLDLASSEISIERGRDGNSVCKESSLPLDLTASDSDSVSSGSTAGDQECGEASHGQNSSRGIVEYAQFWQDMNSRLRRLQDPSSPLSASTCSRLTAQPKLKKHTSDCQLSSTQTPPLPIRGVISSSSPSKLLTPIGSSPSRGHCPSRIRNAVSTICNNFVETPSVLSFAVDIRRGKVGENQILDAHLLRLLYNRYLHWRNVNARTEVGLLVQKHNSEKNLWNAWITISNLRDSATRKRHRLQLLKQKLKLAFIVKGQMTSLEDWASMDENHSLSLLGATEALKASTLRLPTTRGTTADIQSLKDTIDSAVDVIHAVTSSICSLEPMVESINSLATELAKMMGKELALLEQCTDVISLLAVMQVKDSSLRTHILQHNRVTDSLT